MMPFLNTSQCSFDDFLYSVNVSLTAKNNMVSTTAMAFAFCADRRGRGPEAERAWEPSVTP